MAMALAAFLQSLGVSANPLTPSSTISPTEPAQKAITGVAQAIASTITKPKGSGQQIGKSSAAALLRKLLFPLRRSRRRISCAILIDAPPHARHGARSAQACCAAAAAHPPASPQ